MSQSIEVIRAVLGALCHSDAEAAEALAAAEAVGVDPLDYCAHRCGLGAGQTMERAANWANLAFSPTVPSTGRSRAAVHRIDSFATVRSIREKLYDREVIYIAPGFAELVRLKGHVDAHPELRRRTCIVTGAAIRTALAQINAKQLIDESRQRLSRRWPFASGHLDLGRAARLVFVAAAVAIIGAAVLTPLAVESALLPVVGLLLVAPSVFRLAAVLRGPGPARPAPPRLDEIDLPVYSVLIPLYDEAQMVPQLRRAMAAIDYPPEKLDIKFVVEARSRETVAAVKRVLDDPRFELVTVPEAPPFTKPKALDYALPFVRGRHVVVYDAEDVPDPDQLRLAAAAFAADPGVDCLQAELMIDNARENLLTGLFAGEYAGQFGIMLPALAHWRLPIPLGGTSNHFRTEALRELGGWDAFNVTEDADLGVRLARLRYRTAMLPSQTYEEAPVGLGMWMRQRSRWLKGWMQTFIVHNRDPLALLRDIGWRGFLAFELYVGSMILSPLLHTAFVAGLVAAVLTGRAPLPAPADLPSALEFVILVVGYGGSFVLVVAGLLRLGQRRLLAIQLLLPVYWALHAVAAIRAGHELLTRPHFWAKTTHGLTRFERSFGPADRWEDGGGALPAEEDVPPVQASRAGAQRDPVVL